MLKRFTVENFSSFKEKNSLDLTAGRTEILQNHVVVFNQVKLLKSAIIYGANASGKSNLIKAIDFAKDIIENSLNGVNTHKKYFRLDENCKNNITEFVFEIEINKKFYNYGFNLFLEKKTIYEEWLYEIGTKKPNKIFSRKENDIELGQILNNKSIKDRFIIYAEDMKNQSHQLFLSEIAQKNLENEKIKIFNHIYQWFTDKLIIIYPHTKFNPVSLIVSDNKLIDLFKKYLKSFDTGIKDITTIEEDFKKALKDIPIEIISDIEKDLNKKDKVNMFLTSPDGNFIISKNKDEEITVKKLGLIHKSEIDDIFELKDESDGTKRLFDFIPLISKFSDDYTILIDEFDRSLHPKLTRVFFELFYKTSKKTQIITTTHESNLLDLELVRRDEVWFVEKDKYGATKLFSLNQFKERYDKKIAKSYLLGRYGAIPIFRDFDKLKMEQ
jgi:AAA15 family ATPase/GTPase